MIRLSRAMSLTIKSKSAWSVLVVVIVWASMLFAALGLVRRYGTRTFPQGDEVWALYDAGPGISVRWLWKTWAEHRIPLAKLIWKAVLQLTDYDFRVGNFLTVFALAGVALLMIWTANRMRGRTIVMDAFFPLAVLNFGQASDFLWWWQVNQILAPITVSLLLSLVVLHGNNLQLAHAALIGLGLVLLVLCGPGGFPYVITLAVWLGIWAARKRPLLSPSQHKPLLFVLMPVAVAFALLISYFIDYTPYFPVNDPPTVSAWPAPPGLVGSAVACLQILGLSIGTATKSYAALCGFGIFVLGVFTVAILLRIWLKRPNERPRALALVMILAATLALVLVIGRKRAGMGLDYIYQGHYLAHVVPALCCIYFAWEMHGGVSGRCVQLGMLAVLAASLPLNLQQAIHAGQYLQQKTWAFEHDVKSGIPAFILAERHFASDAVPRAEELDRILRNHKANGIGIFREIRDDPAFRIETLDVEAAVLDRMTLHDRVLSSTADSNTSSLTFTLPEPRHIYAIRLQYAYLKTASAWPRLRAYWRNSALQDFNDRDEWVSVVAGPDQPTWALIDGKIETSAKVRADRSLTIWVDATIDQFRFYPDSGPCEIRLSKIELLVPIEEESRHGRKAIDSIEDRQRKLALGLKEAHL
jgi:hypothetical protein